jgi:Tol biopolymer transport system component
MALVVALFTVGLATVLSAFAKDTILANRIGPSASELFIANGDGTQDRKLSPATGFDYDASFSADGKWIVSTSEREGFANIYRVGVDGSGLERLTDNSGFNDQAVLSPDGKLLAFVSTRSSGWANIWILDIVISQKRFR